MDYFIIAVVTLSGLYFHWWLYRRIRRWSDRDLALSMAGDSPQKRQFMLTSLEQAQQQKVSRKALEAWLQGAAERYERDHV
ncbi:hypothetical protein [Halopseudomonas maritima]|uniref:hypothetical protein n=1 Tax=Halopseudomonas maritima TaxID=2918528 RepID=UPI001EEC8CED|nr:hypothetical protein [Halopseudomonas maritima]UJJ31331.1 hypothetical protein HV822_16505 [Halopseudomonas maritima]